MEEKLKTGLAFLITNTDLYHDSQRQNVRSSKVLTDSKCTKSNYTWSSNTRGKNSDKGSCSTSGWCWRFCSTRI